MASVILVEKRDYEPGRPLWQRVPTRDAEGRYLNDFMMLIPRLSCWPERRRTRVFEELDRVFAEFEEVVVFADLNLKLNLLWISMRQSPSGCLGLAAAIKERIPEALLVASQAEAMAGMAGGASRRGARGWRDKLVALIPPMPAGRRC